jgi:hypothetical protein
VDSGAAQGPLCIANTQGRGHGVSLSAFPYTLHRSSLMLLIPIRLQDHTVRVSVALEAIFRMTSAAAATDMGIDWNA